MQPQRLLWRRPHCIVRKICRKAAAAVMMKQGDVVKERNAAVTTEEQISDPVLRRVQKQLCAALPATVFAGRSLPSSTPTPPVPVPATPQPTTPIRNRWLEYVDCAAKARSSKAGGEQANMAYDRGCLGLFPFTHLQMEQEKDKIYAIWVLVMDAMHSVSKRALWQLTSEEKVGPAVARVVDAMHCRFKKGSHGTGDERGEAGSGASTRASRPKSCVPAPLLLLAPLRRDGSMSSTCNPPSASTTPCL